MRATTSRSARRGDTPSRLARRLLEALGETEVVQNQRIVNDEIQPLRQHLRLRWRCIHDPLLDARRYMPVSTVLNPGTRSPPLINLTNRSTTAPHLVRSATTSVIQSPDVGLSPVGSNVNITIGWLNKAFSIHAQLSYRWVKVKFGDARARCGPNSGSRFMDRDSGTPTCRSHAQPLRTAAEAPASSDPRSRSRAARWWDSPALRYR